MKYLADRIVDGEIKGSQEVKRIKGGVWWCPWCDNSSMDGIMACRKCGAVLRPVEESVRSAPPLIASAPTEFVPTSQSGAVYPDMNPTVSEEVVLDENTKEEVKMPKAKKSKKAAKKAKK